jgi:hypothetical protein
MRIWVEIPQPPAGSTAAAEENEESITRLIASLIRRCELESCSKLLERKRPRFCSNEHRTLFHNRARYRI